MGITQTSQPAQWTSAFRGEAENICSQRVFPSLPDPERTCKGYVPEMVSVAIRSYSASGTGPFPSLYSSAGPF